MTKPGDYDELASHLWIAARRGNVPAMRIILEHKIFADGGLSAEAPTDDDAESVIDELAARRRAT